MKKILAVGLVFFLMLGLAVSQENGARPAPKMIQIYREFVKPGHNVAHEKVEAGWPKAFKANKSASTYLGMSAITGGNEAWYVSGYDSYEAWEKATAADEANPALSAEIARLQTADGDHVEGFRALTARFREELSLRKPLNIGDYRYMTVAIVRVRPGMNNQFADLRKKIKEAHEKAGLEDWYSVFEVQSGMPTPTYLIFVPMKSLKEVDDNAKLHTADKYVEALGGAEGQKKMAEANAQIITSTESMIFRFSPKMSNPPANYLVGNADFWTPKPPMMKAKGPQEAKKQ